MKINPINNYSPYSKLNSQPKNNKVSFGAIQDDRTRYLMSTMGLDPKDPIYTKVREFTLYEEGGQLKGKVTLTNALEKEYLNRYYVEDDSEAVEKMLKTHGSVLDNRLVGLYFKMFEKLFYPEQHEDRGSKHEIWFETNP